MSNADLAREAHADDMRSIDPVMIAIDTETGGFHPTMNALLSMTLIELDAELKPSRQLELFMLPEPGRSIEEGAAKVNGYTPELWAKNGAIPLRQAFLEVRKWMPVAPITFLAHNARFDRDFFDHYSALVDDHVHQQIGTWACSMLKFREVAPKLGLRPLNHKLETLARLCGHWGPTFVRGAHGATDDALACAAGYRWLTEQLAAAAQASTNRISKGAV